jgi:hypothetical protein
MIRPHTEKAGAAMEFAEHLFGPVLSDDGWRAAHAEHLDTDDTFTLEPYDDAGVFVWMVCACSARHLCRAHAVNAYGFQM